MSAFSDEGFAAGDVRGTRAWRVDVQGRLRGIVYEKIWRPGENVAECLRGLPAGRVPARGATVTSGGAGTASSVAWPAVTVSGGGGSGSLSSFIIANARLCSCGCGMMVTNDPVPSPCSGIDPECGCGFYGYQEGSNDYYSPALAQSQKGPVGGVVRGYGKVVLGTRGFRAEKAEILALYVDAEALLNSDSKLSDSLIRMRVEQNYKVPVFGDYLDLLKEFPPDPPEHDENFWEAS